MAYFSTFRKRISTYVSPARTDRKRATSSSRTNNSLEQRLDRRSMSPTRRTKKWIRGYTPSSESTSTKTPSVLGVQGAKIAKYKLGKPARKPLAATRGQGERKWSIRLLPPKTIKQKDRNEDYTEDTEDVEGSTLLEGESEGTSQLLASSDDDDQMANDTTLVEGPEYEDDDDQMANDTTLVEDPEYEDDDDQMANGTTLVEGPEYEDDDQESSGKAPDLSHAEKNELLLNMAREYHTRQESFTQIQGDWSESEIALLQKLNMRGFEPLLPEHWMMDFNTIPEPLFTEKDQEVLINSASGRDFRATKALASLLSLGVRVREKIDTSLPPEGTIRREIESYIKWSEIDGRLTTDHHVPVLTVATTKPGQDIQEVVDIVTAKLHALARRYRDKWRIHSTVEASRSKDPADTVKDEYAHDLPTLYGMVISHTVVTFVSHTTAVPYMPVRSIALFDFGDDEHDVWNGFAVAILVVMVRNYLMGLHKFESGTKGAGETKKSDPDA